MVVLSFSAEGNAMRESVLKFRAQVFDEYWLSFLKPDPLVVL